MARPHRRGRRRICHAKITVGAVVGNEHGELLMVQRADSGVGPYPTGWADVGYSPSRLS